MKKLELDPTTKLRAKIAECVKHPMQPVYVDEQGTHRFKPNAIVDFLLDNGGYDMNDLAYMEFSVEDRTQFAQLIGYSCCGFTELSYVTNRAATTAMKRSEKLAREKGATK